MKKIIVLAVFAMIAGFATLNAPALAQQVAAKSDLDRRLDTAANGAKQRCGRDFDCNLSITSVQLPYINVVAACVSVGMQVADIQLKMSMAAIDGKEIDAAEKARNEAAVAQATQACDNSKREIAELTITALEKIDLKKK